MKALHLLMIIHGLGGEPILAMLACLRAIWTAFLFSFNSGSTSDI